MGCATVKTDKEGVQLPSCQNIAGVLKITITNGVLFHQAGVFTMDPYLNISLLNQVFTSKVCKKGGVQPNFNETFTFFINSSQKMYGRNLQISLMDKKKIGPDNFIGYGVTDMNPIINQIKNKHEFRLILNYQYKQAGFLNIIAQFVEQPSQFISFRIDQAIIRRNLSAFGSSNCHVQIKIGEQYTRTAKRKQTKEKPPTWSDKIIKMRVIRSIPAAVIRIMNDEKQVGKIEIPISKFLQKEDEQIFAQDFCFNTHLYAGTLKFSTIKGKFPNKKQSNNKQNEVVQNQQKKAQIKYSTQQTEVTVNALISQNTNKI